MPELREIDLESIGNHLKVDATTGDLYWKGKRVRTSNLSTVEKIGIGSLIILTLSNADKIFSLIPV